MVKAQTVTAIKSQEKRANRVSLFLDGKFTMGLSASVLEESGIRAGHYLSQAQVNNLKIADQSQRAKDRALKYLSYRPRSESEVRDRLKRYGYEDAIIATTLDRLRNAGYVDDASFAEFWKENRSTFSSRSTRFLVQELKQKGIDPEIINATIENIDNETEAYRAGYKKSRTLTTTDRYEFRKKLGAFLRRRGFDYNVISTVIEQLWNEKLCEDRNEL